MKKALILAGLLLLLPACGEHKSGLDEGVCGGMDCKPRRVSVHEAEEAGHMTLASWRKELRRGVAERPNVRFENLSPSELRGRLGEAAKRYDFEVVAVRLHRPRQLAPEIVVRTKHYIDLTRAAPAILRRLDPKRSTSDDRTGWRFEGFYFRAEDEHGVPFLIVRNFWRSNGGGGGQWARSERLYPFEHA